MGRLVITDKLEETTPAKFKNIIVEHFRQSFPEEYNHQLQRYFEAGKITQKNLEAIIAENNKLGNDINVSAPNPLIKELNALVYDRVMFGA